MKRALLPASTLTVVLSTAVAAASPKLRLIRNWCAVYSGGQYLVVSASNYGRRKYYRMFRCRIRDTWGANTTLECGGPVEKFTARHAVCYVSAFPTKDSSYLGQWEFRARNVDLPSES
jgi:hypothetical protein